MAGEILSRPCDRVGVQLEAVQQVACRDDQRQYAGQYRALRSVATHEPCRNREPDDEDSCEDRLDDRQRRQRKPSTGERGEQLRAVVRADVEQRMRQQRGREQQHPRPRARPRLQRESRHEKPRQQADDGRKPQRVSRAAVPHEHVERIVGRYRGHQHVDVRQLRSDRAPPRRLREAELATGDRLADYGADQEMRDRIHAARAPVRPEPGAV